jgi:T5SS/PEP-CTERM-associated repeat protein/autotransporter passenger strand-loop-strand repeat protein
VTTNISVTSGQTSAGITLSGGAFLFVSSGGTVSGTTVSSGSADIVYAGGQASGTIVSSGGAESLQGGAASGTTLIGEQDIFAGGEAISTTVVSGGYMIVFSGGTATGTIVNFQKEKVESGGSASFTTVNSGGQETLEHDGTASFTTVNSGGFEFVSAGTAISSTVRDGGGEFVAPGGTIIGTTVSSGGHLIVAPGGIASATSVLPGGAVVSTGAVFFQAGSGSTTLYPSSATGIAVATEDAVAVLPGGTAISTTLSGYFATQLVYFSGSADFTTVDSGSFDYVSSGGVASATTVNRGGAEIVFSGGTVIGAMVNSGGAEVVLPGGAASGTVVSVGGTFVVLPGGTAAATTGTSISTGIVLFQNQPEVTSDTVIVYGSRNGFVAVSGGDTEYVMAGGSAGFTAISSGGTEAIYSGGLASFTSISGGGTEIVYSGGTVTGTTISGGGLEIVLPGGTANGGVVSGGGTLIAIPGSTVDNTTGTVVSTGVVVVRNNAVIDTGPVNVFASDASGVAVGGGDTAYVLANGTAVSTTVGSGGTVTVFSGGSASFTTVSSLGMQFVDSGGVASGTTIDPGGLERLVGGTASFAVVGNSGFEVVSSGGTAIGATVLSGGAEFVLPGGTASGATVSSGGYLIVAPDSVVNNTTLEPGSLVVSTGVAILQAGSGVLLVEASATGLVLSGSHGFVFPDGTVTSTTVNSGGDLSVYTGGQAIGTTANTGAQQDLQPGGTATGTVVSGGAEFVHEGATATGTVVNGNGSTFVYTAGAQILNFSGAASGTIVNSGGRQIVTFDATAFGTTVSGGGYEILSGGTASGTTLKPGGMIDLAELTYAGGGSAGVNSAGLLTVSVGGGSYSQQLSGTYTSDFFVLAPDANGGTVLTEEDANSTVIIPPGDTVDISGPLPPGEPIAFAPGAPETLILGSPTGTISTPITGFTYGDNIEFSNGVTVTAVAFSNGNTFAVTYHIGSGSPSTYDLTDVPFTVTTPLSFLTGTDAVTGDANFTPTTFLTWIGPNGGNFATAANWNLGSVAPSVATYVNFSNGIGGTITGTGTVEGFNFTNTGTWSLASGVSLAAATTLNIGLGNGGANADGALTVGGGSTLSIGGYINVGGHAGNVTTLTISGGGVLNQTAPGSSGSMEVANATASGTLAAASASVLVTGAGSILNLGSNALYIANGGGTGSVLVSLGGSVIASSYDDNVLDPLSIGYHGNGTLTVTDPGSQATLNGVAYLAHTGTGTLVVENSGSVLLAPDPVGLVGLSIGDGNQNGVGGTGVAMVSTNGVLDDQGYMFVGLRGTEGQLSVLNGGTVQVGTTLYVADGGTITTSGAISAGTTETASGTVTIGTGATLELTGPVQTLSYGVYLGDSNNGNAGTENAVATVSGVGALLNTNGNGLDVAQDGTASLTVSQGGSVAAGTADSSLISALAIARQGSGTVTVTDPGSQVTANGFVYVSRGGTGSLIVENQGSVAIGFDGKGAGGLQIGGGGTSTGGTLFVGGTGTALITAGGSVFSEGVIEVGLNGSTGSLTVADGAVQTDGQLRIGASTVVATGGTVISPTSTTVVLSPTVETGTGAVTVGSGGVLTVDQSGSSAVAIALGDTAGSTGALSVTNGGTVIAGGGLSLFQNATASIAAGGGMSVGGGTINAGASLINAGTLTDLGTLDDSGNFTNADTVSGGATIAGSGTLSNSAGATIGGAVAASAAGETVSNLGTVDGAVSLNGGDRLVTGAGAVFSGGITGGTGGNTLEIATGPYALSNFDAMGTPQYTTLQIDNGVSVTTDATDTLTGVTLINDGTLNLNAFEATSPVQNSGSITGDVTLASGVPLTNAADGTISGSGLAAIEALGPASVSNSGVIDPATYGVDLTVGGSVTNAAGGTIEGTVAGVLISGGAGTVTNAGLISGGGTDAVTLAAGFANRVILDPGATFSGAVDGGNTIGASAASTLELASTSATGTLSGLGTEFVNFAQALVDAGASWSLAGESTLAAGTTLTDQGALMLNGTTVVGGGKVTIDGTAGLPASATVEGGGSWSGTSDFVIGEAGAGGLLVATAGSVSTSAADVAQGVGSSGTITVTGAESLLNDTGSLVVGDGGLGALAIQAGGTVTAGAGLVIANTASSDGSSVNLSGTGSSLQVIGLLDVGVDGSGGLSIGDGATVAAGTLDAGNIASAVANISVSDADFTVSGDATVADDGTGVLSVLAGATFTAGNLTIGNQGDSSGALVVSGSGSVVNVSGDLNVGTSLGTGDLTIGPGATVNALVVNLQGEVVLENGELDPTVNLINQGQTAGGSGTIAAGDIVDEGVIQAGGSKPSQKLLVVAGTILGGGPWTINQVSQFPANSDTGILQINAGGTMELTGPVLNAGSTTFTDDVTPQSTYSVSDSVVDVNFEDATGVLKIDDIGGFAGTIAAFRKGDSFVITGGTLSNLGVSSNNTLTVSDSGNGGTDNIIFASPISTSGFTIVNNNTIQVSCFARGTRIATETGPVAVEDLCAGDRVITADGTCEPIVWLGQRPVNCERHPKPEAVWPVRVRAGSFGRNVPVRDLYLSPDHAVFVNGALVPVKLLINGTSIEQVKRNAVTYYHVELPRHAVILAEGLTVESYLDLGERADFANSSETIRLFPNFAAGLAPDAALAWETRGTAPLVLAGDKLAAARGMVMPPRGFRSSAQIPRTG